MFSPSSSRSAWARVRQMIPAFHESGDWLYAVEGLTKPRKRSHKPGVKMAFIPAADDTLITVIRTDFCCCCFKFVSLADFINFVCSLVEQH